MYQPPPVFSVYWGLKPRNEHFAFCSSMSARNLRTYSNAHRDAAHLRKVCTNASSICAHSFGHRVDSLQVPMERSALCAETVLTRSAPPTNLCALVPTRSESLSTLGGDLQMGVISAPVKSNTRGDGAHTQQVRTHPPTS